MTTPFTAATRVVVAALLMVAGALTLATPGAANAAGVIVEGQSAFRPVTPCRLADTRTIASGATPLDGSTIRVQVTGRCGVTAGASAAAISIAVADASAPGFASITPAGTPGATSTINWSAGEIRSASTVVKLSVEGALDITVSAGLGKASVIIDVSGQWDRVNGAVSAGRMITVSGTRVLDTRTTSSRLLAGRTLSLGRIALGIPAGAIAITGTLVSTGSSGAGFLTGFASGEPVPVASNVNTDGAGQSRSAGVIIPVSDLGLTIAAGSADTDVVLDITGYVTGADDAQSSNGLLVPVDPTRLLDTRSSANPVVTSANVGLSAPLTGVTLTGIIATLTSTSATAPGFASVRSIAGGAPVAVAAQPTSSLNWAGTPGAVASMAIQSVEPSRQLLVSASSPTALILDATAYLIGETATVASWSPVSASDQPRVIGTGIISDTTRPAAASGSPIAFLGETYTAEELRAGGAVAIVNGAVPNGAPAMVPYVASSYPVCGTAPTCIMLDGAHWQHPGNDPLNSNRVMISHEFGHVLAMRYQASIPVSQLAAWQEKYAMVNEECVADSVATIVLARGNFSPNQTAAYSVHYDCDALWTSIYGADHLAEMRAMSIDLAAQLLGWAQQWGTEHPA